MSKKDVRKKFKDSVFKRDNYTCRHCHFTYGINSSDAYLDAHHITDRNEMPNGGYVVEGMRGLIGVPSFEYNTAFLLNNTFW